MPSIEFAGKTVRLAHQKRPAFEGAATSVYEQPDDDRSIELLYAAYAQGLVQEGRDHDDSLVQAALWSLVDFGVKSVGVEDDGESVKILDNDPTPVSRGEASSYTFAALRDGRSFAPAIANVRGRSLVFNGERRDIRRNPKETVEAVMALIAESRLADEELFITTARVVAALYEHQGEDATEEHVDAAFELATDLGIDEMKIEEDGSIELGALNVANAMASAVLQGFDVEEVMALRKRLDTINELNASM